MNRTKQSRYRPEPWWAGILGLYKGGSLLSHPQCHHLPSTGYEGVYCEINTDECASSPCLHNGHCIDKINEFLCQCPKGEATCLPQDLCPLDLLPDYFEGGLCLVS